MIEVVSPVRTAYRGPITDTGRWERFQQRPDDIFICTPAKCGTTWTQAICAMLAFGTTEHGQQPGVISPWIDADFAPIEDYLAMVDQQTHRRFIKTHTPFDGIPYFPECTYLAIFRDPRDVYFSGSNHRDNMNDQALATAAFPSGDNAFDIWLNETIPPGAWDRWSLEPIVHMFRTYWDYRHLPNLHLFHYSDMNRDLKGAISAMARATGTTLTEADLEAYTKAGSFDHMKSRAEQFAPESGTGMWKSEAGFFASGRNRQWQDRLTPEQLAAFDARIGSLLGVEQRQWLLNGGG